MPRSREPADAPPPVLPWLERHGRRLTLFAAVALLAGGFFLIRGYWRRTSTERAREELAQALTLDKARWLDHLERLAPQFADTDAAPEIRYRLGCAYLQADRLDDARRVFEQLEKDLPGTPWADKAAAAGVQIAQARALEDTEPARREAIRAQALSQRRFLAPPETPDPRAALLPAPRDPGAGTGTPTADPAKFSGIEKP